MGIIPKFLYFFHAKLIRSKEVFTRDQESTLKQIRPQTYH